MQFKLRTLFLVCLIVAAGAWLYQWSRWPARTIQDFAKLIQQEKFDEAAARLEFEDDFLVSPDDLVHRVHVARIVCDNSERQSRSIADIVYGRQTYKAVGNQACYVDLGRFKTHWLVESLTVERGKIRFNWRGPSRPHGALRKRPVG